MRVAYVNMTQSGATCPHGLEQQSFCGNEYCGRFSPGEGCVSAAINTSFSYHKQQVFGRVARYERDGPDGFQPFNVRINQVYFEGLCMVLLVNTFGHMLLDSMKTMLEIMIVRAMMDPNLKPLLMLVVTTTVH